MWTPGPEHRGAFLELARGLGVTTLAEGIETEGELAFLLERGCVMGQGFHFSKPVPPRRSSRCRTGAFRSHTPELIRNLG